MPQWDFLNFIAGRASRHSSFRLLMQHKATDLLQDDEIVFGVVAQHQGQELQVRADLVVNCDGRHSRTRTIAGLQVTVYGVPIDVLWFRISRKPDEVEQVLGNVNYGKR